MNWILQPDIAAVTQGRVTVSPVSVTGDGKRAAAPGERWHTAMGAGEKPSAALPREMLTLQINATLAKIGFGQISAAGELQEVAACGSCGVAADSWWIREHSALSLCLLGGCPCCPRCPCCHVQHQQKPHRRSDGCRNRERNESEDPALTGHRGASIAQEAGEISCSSELSVSLNPGLERHVVVKRIMLKGLEKSKK